MPATPTKKQNFQSVQQSALPAMGYASRTENETIMLGIDANSDTPLRLFATFPTADTKLNIGASTVERSNGTGLIAPPVDDNVGTFVVSTVDLSTGAITGGTVTLDGGAFALPTTTIGQFRRLAFVQKSDGSVDSRFSAAAASVGALENPGSIWSNLDGANMGYIDLEAYGATTYKTAGSATNVIENKETTNIRIFNVGSGGGTGGGGAEDFVLNSISGSTAQIKKGFMKVSDGRILVTGNGTDTSTAPAVLFIDLDTVITNSPGGLTQPADNTTYYLYIDLETLPDPISLTDGRDVINVVEANFKLLTLNPREVNPLRYANCGYIHSADTGNAWTGTGATFGERPPAVHDLLGALVQSIEKKTITVTTSTTATVAHGLSAKPNFFSASYTDGTDEVPRSPTNYITDYDDTNIDYNSLAEAFGSGQTLTIIAMYIPVTPNAVVSNADRFKSSFLTSSGTTTLPHTLTDKESIKGISIIERDTTLGRDRVLPANTIVQNYDDTNLYLDWTGYSPSATLQYQIVTGASPLPSQIPIDFSGYTKLVGFGPGSYNTLADAIAAAEVGDSILVNKSYSISSAETISVSDIYIRFMPGVIITVTGGSEALVITGDDVHIEGARYLVNFAGTLTEGIQLNGDDCQVVRAKIEVDNAGLTVTNAYRLSGSRGLVEGAIKTTNGTVTNTVFENGTDNDFSIRG